MAQLNYNCSMTRVIRKDIQFRMMMVQCVRKILATERIELEKFDTILV